MSIESSIANLRQQFEDELTSNASLYHPIDIERVRSEEWQVKRFLLGHPDSEATAFASLCKSLKWKKEFGLHERTDQYFPREFWEMAGAEIYAEDKEGRPIHWGTVKHLKHHKETAQAVLQFLAHITERVDRLGGEKGFIIVVDNNGGQLSNISLENAKFVITILEYYPLGLRRVYSVDLPWVLRAITNLILSLCSAKLREMVHIVDAAGLAKEIDPVHIPAELKGGKREKKMFPGELISLRDCYSKFNLDEKFVAKFFKAFDCN